MGKRGGQEVRKNFIEKCNSTGNFIVFQRATARLPNTPLNSRIIIAKETDKLNNQEENKMSLSARLEFQ
jgi:hypothetical protein